LIFLDDLIEKEVVIFLDDLIKQVLDKYYKLSLELLIKNIENKIIIRLLNQYSKLLVFKMRLKDNLPPEWVPKELVIAVLNDLEANNKATNLGGDWSYILNPNSSGCPNTEKINRIITGDRYLELNMPSYIYRFIEKVFSSPHNWDRLITMDEVIQNLTKIINEEIIKPNYGVDTVMSDKMVRDQIDHIKTQCDVLVKKHQLVIYEDYDSFSYRELSKQERSISRHSEELYREQQTVLRDLVSSLGFPSLSGFQCFLLPRGNTWSATDYTIVYKINFPIPTEQMKNILLDKWDTGVPFLTFKLNTSYKSGIRATLMNNTTCFLKLEYRASNFDDISEVVDDLAQYIQNKIGCSQT